MRKTKVNHRVIGLLLRLESRLRFRFRLIFRLYLRISAAGARNESKEENADILTTVQKTLAERLATVDGTSLAALAQIFAAC